MLIRSLVKYSIQMVIDIRYQQRGRARNDSISTVVFSDISIGRAYEMDYKMHILTIILNKKGKKKKERNSYPLWNDQYYFLSRFLLEQHR